MGLFCENNMTIKLEEVAPNCWRVAKNKSPEKRSHLAFPMIISDEMPPTEQVNGQFYTSKSEFRKVGRALGLVEIGTEKPKQTVRSTAKRETKAARMRTLQKAIAEYKAGRRPQSQK